MLPSMTECVPIHHAHLPSVCAMYYQYHEHSCMYVICYLPIQCIRRLPTPTNPLSSYPSSSYPCLPTLCQPSLSVSSWSSAYHDNHHHDSWPCFTLCHPTATTLAGDIETNPGPRTPKYPCGECKKACTSYKGSQASILCDSCNLGFTQNVLA